MIQRTCLVLLVLAWPGVPVVQAQAPAAGGQVLLFGTAGGATSAQAPPTEKLDVFDEHSLELRWGQGGWQLWAGQLLLKDFGRKEQDGRVVLDLIRELHLNARGRLGSPHAVAEYWLSDGKPPQAAPNGAHTLAFDPLTLSVLQVNNQWMLRDRNRALLSFGNNETEARRALAIFQRYNFDHVGYIGEPSPTFMYFLSTTGGLSRAEAVANRAAHSRSQMDGDGQAESKFQRRGDARKSVDPRQGSQLLPPGRQLIQLTSLPGQAALPDRLPFNWQRARVHQLGENWELASQDLTIARFGPDATAARSALSLLRHYHFTELCLIGGDQPCFQFLLANGKMPREVRFGLSNIAFHPEQVQVVQRNGTSRVEADGVCLCDFGARADAAQALAAFIQQNNPDHLCWIGPDAQHGMTFFVRQSLAPFNSRNDARPTTASPAEKQP
jgi:hypothetical protein